MYEKYKYNGRADNGIQLLKNAKYMMKNAFQYLIRGNGKFGGVIIDRKWVTEESSGKRKEVAIVVTPERDIVEEPLMIYNEKSQQFEPVYHELGGIVVLTAKTHKDDEINLMRWLPPEEAKPISELKEYIRELELSLTELDNNRQEIEHSLEVERLKAQHAEELVNSLQRQLRTLSAKLVSIEGEIERIRAKQQAEHAIVVAMKEQVSELVNTLIKISTEQGKEPYKLTIEVLEKTMKIASLVSRIKTDKDNELKGELEMIKTELDNIKNALTGAEKEAKEFKKEVKKKEEEVAENLAEIA